MDERCKAAHAKLLAGTCPWCRRPIINGVVSGELEDWLDNTTRYEGLISDTSLIRVVERVGALDHKRAARYVEEVASELNKLHDAMRLHGNVCPQNIFVDQAGAARLGPSVDPASLTTIVDDNAAERKIYEMLDCLAPERAISAKVDGRADIYSLGCTFYHLLTGRPPFPSGSISERLLQHQTANPDPLHSLRPDVPQVLVDICKRMMAKKPIDRYQTAKDVVEAVGAWRRSEIAP